MASRGSPCQGDLSVEAHLNKMSTTSTVESTTSTVESTISTVERMYEGMKIGCNDFMTVYANIDRIRDVIPDFITVDGQRVPVRTLRADGFKALLFKIRTSLEATGFIGIGEYSLDRIETSAFLCVICQETPFHLKAYKLIYNGPVIDYDYGEAWDVSGGLQNLSEEKGLGTRLMKATEALAQAYRIEYIRIDSVDEAISFYEKFGMTPYKDDDDGKNIMVKRVGKLDERNFPYSFRTKYRITGGWMLYMRT